MARRRLVGRRQALAAVLPMGAVVGGAMVERKRNPGTSAARLLVVTVGAVLVVLVALVIYIRVSPWSPFANIPD